MKTLGNIIWHIPFLGFVNALVVALAGLFWTITFVGAPIGVGLLEYSKFLLWPFGNSMVSKSDLKIEQNTLWKAYSTIIMVIYFPFGLILCCVAIFQIVALFVTIVGIPPAIVIAKSLGTYLNPVNKKCVDSAVSDELEKRKSQKEVEKYI